MSELKVGIQAYSLRGLMEKDMDNAFSIIKQIGYDYVELAGYYGKSSKEIKSLLDNHGLKCLSVHQSYVDFLDNNIEQVEFLKEIGVKFVAIPWMDVKQHKGNPEFEKTKSDIIQVGKLLKENGMTLLYHNHDFEFQKFENKYLLDWLFEEIDEDLLETQIDTCWVTYAGVDPVNYIKKYKGRVPIVHLKDFSDENGFEFKALGTGRLDVKGVIKASVESGTDYFVVEYDETQKGLTEVEMGQMAREYLKTIGV